MAHSTEPGFSRREILTTVAGLAAGVSASGTGEVSAAEVANTSANRRRVDRLGGGGLVPVVFTGTAGSALGRLAFLAQSSGRLGLLDVLGRQRDLARGVTGVDRDIANFLGRGLGRLQARGDIDSH